MPGQQEHHALTGTPRRYTASMTAGLRPPYTLRTSTTHDAPDIAAHRALMFRDMGQLTDAQAALLREATEPWIRSLLQDGSYLGWILLCEGAVVGGGMHLRPHGPIPGCLDPGLSGHIANIYIDPAHRRRGLAEALVHEMLAWSHSNPVRELTLTASEQGRSLYRRLGFTGSPDFHILRLTPDA